LFKRKPTTQKVSRPTVKNLLIRDPGFLDGVPKLVGRWGDHESGRPSWY
jgi:hypothetical protein